jgi:3-oxoadipate enol-lactonase
MSSTRGTVRTADSQVAWLSVGEGEPVTVFGHGLGSSIAETRMLVSALPGTQVFLSFRGHAGTTEDPGARWTYDALADDLLAVADTCRATRALGISLGAVALTRALLREPDRFERVVFFTPAVLEHPRTDVGFDRIREMGSLVARGDVDALQQLLLAELPDVVRGDARAVAYLRTRAHNLTELRLTALIEQLAGEVVVASLTQLAAITVPALVITQAGDAVHPDAVGQRLAAALPGARHEAFGEGGAMWADLPRLHRVLTEFLAD